MHLLIHDIELYHIIVVKIYRNIYIEFMSSLISVRRSYFLEIIIKHSFNQETPLF